MTRKRWTKYRGLSKKNHLRCWQCYLQNSFNLFFYMRSMQCVGAWKTVALLIREKRENYVNTTLFVFVFSKDCERKKWTWCLHYRIVFSYLYDLHLSFSHIQFYVFGYFLLYNLLFVNIKMMSFNQSISTLSLWILFTLSFKFSFFQRQSSTNFNSLFSSTVFMKRYQKMPIILLLEACIG